MAKSKKKRISLAKTGAFEVIKDYGADFDYIRIRSIAENWYVSYRSDSPMFGVMEMICQNKEFQEGLPVLCTLSFIATNSLFDEIFLTDFFNAYDAMQKRRLEKSPQTTDKESDEAILDAETLMSVADNTDKL